MKRWPTQSSVLALLLAAILGALVSWLGFAIWFAWGDGQHQLLPAYLRPGVDAKTGALQAPLHFPNRESFHRALSQGLEKVDLPSVAERAARQILPSVVHLRVELGQADAAKNEQSKANAGSGVIVKEDGTILTNFHVVASAAEGKLIISFADGSESEGSVIQVMLEKDLAIVRPTKIPDDLQPATLAGGAALQAGDQVVAVGFPFGIGPSVSAGVVSGLDREFRSPDGKRSLRGLIQFDAAANPGSSGGPLVNQRGEVVGIVTAILNPEKSRTFIGIGFATTMESAGSAMGLPRF